VFAADASHFERISHISRLAPLEISIILKAFATSSSLKKGFETECDMSKY
jgi:hypothetical protein